MMADPRYPRLLAASAMAVSLLCGSVAGAVEARGMTLTATDSERTAPPPSEVDPQQERQVLKMVRNHLPELQTLLDRLKDKEPRQYGIAIRNLSKSARRLEIARRRGEEAFEIEVNVIQAQSAVNLLIAKLKVRDNKKDRQALREAAERLSVAELARSRYELSLMQSRLERLREQVATAKERIEQRESQLDQTIQKNYQSFLRKSGQK